MINLNLLKLMTFFLFFILNMIPSFSHPILPIEFMEFLDNNPYATQEDIEEFMVNTYGTALIENILISNYGDLYNESYLKQSNETLLKLGISNDSEINKSFSQNAIDFLILGVEHIIFGFDHVLFVLSLILVFSSYKEIFQMVTTFTIAHSLTFILAGTNLLILSGKIVEPIIAFSIAYVAITSVFFNKYDFFQKKYNKLIVIFIFGLFHGLGFAGVFSILNIPTNQYISSLLFFNIGVEIGQILILILIVPFFMLLKKQNEKLFGIFIKIISVIISILAIFWVIQRIFF